MKRHALDPLSLIFGILFFGAAALYTSDLLDIRLINIEWVVAGALLALGAGLLLSAARRSDTER